MMMKRILPFLVFLITISAFGQQNREQRREKIRTLKIAFITEKLNLTENEAEKFWPIYNAFDKNRSKIRHQDMRKIGYELRQGMETISDEKAGNLLNKLMEAENQLHKERVQLVKKLRNVISAKKIILLKSAEDDFNKKMLEQYKKRRQQQRIKNKRP